MNARSVNCLAIMSGPNSLLYLRFPFQCLVSFCDATFFADIKPYTLGVFMKESFTLSDYSDTESALTTFSHANSSSTPSTLAVNSRPASCPASFDRVELRQSRCIDDSLYQESDPSAQRFSTFRNRIFGKVAN